VAALVAVLEYWDKALAAAPAEILFPHILDAVVVAVATAAAKVTVWAAAMAVVETLAPATKVASAQSEYFGGQVEPFLQLIQGTYNGSLHTIN
jgi:hypothetical protein